LATPELNGHYDLDPQLALANNAAPVVQSKKVRSMNIGATSAAVADLKLSIEP
jgi:hypothetical protein